MIVIIFDFTNDDYNHISMEVEPRLTLMTLLDRLLELLGDKGLDELSAMEVTGVKELMTSYEVSSRFWFGFRSFMKKAIAQLVQKFENFNRFFLFFFSSLKSNRADWDKYALFDPAKYTRNLVSNGNGKFNLLILCWGEGTGR